MSNKKQQEELIEVFIELIATLGATFVIHSVKAIFIMILWDKVLRNWAMLDIPYMTFWIAFGVSIAIRIAFGRNYQQNNNIDK